MPTHPTSQPPAPWGTVYASRRAALLERLIATLRGDARIVAFWLTGSFGRGEEDAYSDIDATAVVTVEHASALCARPWRHAGRTTAERLALFERFGTVVLAHDAHGNAPEGGTHTNVVYADGTRLDLNLVPLDRARRASGTRLVFERTPVPQEAPASPEALEQRRHEAEQRIALFWIMALGTAKERRRGRAVSVQAMLTALRGHVEEVRRLVAGEAPRFRRHTLAAELATTPAAQAAALQALCDEMERLLPEVQRLGGEVPPALRTQVEWWLSDG